MSDKIFSQLVDFKLESSLYKVLLIAVPHLIIVLLIFSSWFYIKSFSILFVFTDLIIAFLSTVYFWRLHINQSSSQSICSVRNDSNSNWVLSLVNGSKKTVVLLPSSFVSNLFILLIFQDVDNKKYVALITSDSLKQSSFRRLRVRLRLGQTDVS